jgi:hypothetical protein
MAKYITCHRRGTAEQWDDKATIIPYEGEIVIEIDEEQKLHKLKIGDGKTPYSELKYLMAGDEIVTQVLAEVKPRIVTVELKHPWTQVTDGKYSQVIELEGITKQSRLDLQPSADMIAEFKQLGLVFVTENQGGTITVYSVGNQPLKSYTMQATIVETECTSEDVIVGIPIGTSKSTDGLATESYVDTKVASLVNSAPETLDTLNELATALGEDPNFATTMATQLGNKQDKLEDTQITNINSIPNIQSGLDNAGQMAFNAGQSAFEANTVAHSALTKVQSLEDAQITVDTSMSNTSENPVQNKVISEYLAGMNRQLTGGITNAYNIATNASNNADTALEQIASLQDEITEIKNQLLNMTAGL